MNQHTMDEPHTDSDAVTSTDLVTTPTNDSAALPPRAGLGDGAPAASKPRGGGGGGRFLAALGVLVLGFGGGVGGFYAADQWSGDDSEAASQQSLQPSNASSSSDGSSSTPVADTGEAETPGQIYEQVSPAVVHINAEITTTQSFFGIPQEEEATGTGSGKVAI